MYVEKYLPSVLDSPFGEVAETVFSTVQKTYNSHLNEYRLLRREKDKLEELLSSFQQRLEEIERRIPLLQNSIESYKPKLIIFGILTLLFLFLSIVHPVWFIIFIPVAFLLFYFYAQESSKKKELQTLQNEMQALKDETIPQHTERLGIVTDQISNFRLPDLKLRIYKVYVPIGFTSLNGNLLAVTPLGEKVELSLKFTTETEEFTHALREIQRVDEFYKDTLVKGKWEGSGVVSMLEKVGLWDKVCSTHSPEYLLVEVASREAKRLLGLVQEKEIGLTLIPPVYENVNILQQALSKAAEGKLARAKVLKGSEESLADLFSKIEGLQTLVQYLSTVEDFIVEAESVGRESEDFRDLQSRLMELIEATIPVEPFTGFAERVYCKLCADQALEDIMRRIDLKKWIEINVIGGVSEDPDIIVPIPELLEDVKNGYSKIENTLLAKLPLPALGVKVRTKELYERGMKTYATALSAADVYIRTKLGLPFEEPELVCEKCNLKLDSGNSYTVSTLALPYIKAYVGTMYELADIMYKKSETIRLSINEARLAKDQRKSGIGIYEQMVHENEIRKEALKNELDRLKEHKARLMVLAGALAASVGIEEVKNLEAIASGAPITRGD